MKKHITKKQWNELSNDLQQKFCDIHNLKYIDLNHQRNIETYLQEYLSIGQMIEFLGDEWFTPLNWGVSYRNTELCDALWEVVKYKIAKL